MERIREAFQRSRAPRLIPFIMAGDPDMETTVSLLRLLDQEGATAVEVGFPFSDPLADGPVIQQAAWRALSQGVTLHRLWEMVSIARERGVQVPLILFSYYNPLLSYGLRPLVTDAKRAGFNGLIVPDLPVEESEGLRELCDQAGLALIPLVAPTSRERIGKIASRARGFVYCVSSLGTTGRRERFSHGVERFLQEVRSRSPVPTVVGFGISRGEHVRHFSRFADGVVVGSALVEQIASVSEKLRREEDRPQALEDIRRFVRRLKTE
jgi:tryptophan synthase alpha chain